MKLSFFWKYGVIALVIGAVAGAFGVGISLEKGNEESLYLRELELWQRYQHKVGPEIYAQEAQSWKKFAQDFSGDSQQRSRAYKGWGDGLFLAGDFSEACSAYREALRWDSDNEGARLNLCLAMERLPEQERNPEQKQKNDGEGQGGNGNSQPPPKPEPSQTPKQPQEGQDDESRQILRHLVEQERERTSSRIVQRDLKPPRGTETW